MASNCTPSRPVVPTTKTSKYHIQQSGDILLNIIANDDDENNENASPSTTTNIKSLFPRKRNNLHLDIASTHTAKGSDYNLSTVDMINNECSTSSSTSAMTTTKVTDVINPIQISETINRLNIGFDNLRYSKRTGFFRNETKTILNGLTGMFRAGELTAIVGPSGAGKSTFLNILSGYTTFGYNGEVTVNGRPRIMKEFKPNVVFIAQDTSLQPYLTVKEAMHFAANLKIGKHLNNGSKRERINKILEAIGMYENRNTRTGQLSGGQKKRLAIAMELVNNPPVLILDEPTSGLDSSTSKQCISLLKKLASEGRTVICTIHQPSALTFKLFDHLYAIASGNCIYSGGIDNLLVFLDELNIPCPEFYNPADYLVMEIATDDYGSQNHKLMEKIENGRNNKYRQSKASKRTQLEAMQKIDEMMISGLITPVNAPSLNAVSVKSMRNAGATPSLISIKEIPTNFLTKPTNVLNIATEKPKFQFHSPNLCGQQNIYATPFYHQINILLIRTFTILWRDRSLSAIRIIISLVTAFLIGWLYYGIGNDAGNALNNFRYCFYSIMFIMFTAFSSILVKFPLELPILCREHFNRWYSLKAYYIAMTLADIPVQLSCTSIYIIITYKLTDQPAELFRLVLFCMIVFLTALVGQSIGLAIGASLNIKIAAILGPFLLCPFLMFSGFFLQEKDTSRALKWLFKASFLKYSFDGSVVSIFGFERSHLPCNDMYCHYSRPKSLLKDVDMLGANYLTSAIVLFFLFLSLRILSFYIMSFRLRLLK
uniref:ABC transporter domain-containing protein n=1 Tax=Glossina brevipalpis TaxID=37001 RepID=A0A1A9WZY3_9MUSC